LADYLFYSNKKRKKMKLASIEKIDKLLPHPNADRLELVQVLGYQAVVPKGLHKEGDVIVYIQPDTVLPKDQEWAEEYIKYSPKRVKAVRLRGEWSEGVVAPLSKFKETLSQDEFATINVYPIGTDVSNIIGVVKYDPPLPKDTEFTGGLPYQLPKTDEERFENMLKNLPFGEVVDVTLKIDGQSTTHGYNVTEDRYFVTGRRYEVDAESKNRYSVHVPKVKEAIIAYCKEHNVSLAFRAESYGNGIQSSSKNVHSSKPHSLAFFSIWNLDERCYEEKGSEHYFLNVCPKIGLETVDVLEKNVVLTEELIKKYSVDMKKLPNGNAFEGVVIKHSNGSFKVINKHYDANK
jgi:RNA ligase (TIGR02306 family)